MAQYFFEVLDNAILTLPKDPRSYKHIYQSLGFVRARNLIILIFWGQRSLLKIFPLINDKIIYLNKLNIAVLLEGCAKIINNF
jgi:hypothetical protein